MGWDAYAASDGERLDILFEGQDRGRIENPQARAAFARANLALCEIMGCGDAYLTDGCLGPGSRWPLEVATRQVCFDATIAACRIYWPTEKVRLLNANANWDFDYEQADPLGEHYYWAARIFLKTCAGQGLGVLFDW